MIGGERVAAGLEAGLDREARLARAIVVKLAIHQSRPTGKAGYAACTCDWESHTWTHADHQESLVVELLKSAP